MRTFLLLATSATMLFAASSALAQDNAVQTDKFKPRIYGGPAIQTEKVPAPSTIAPAKKVQTRTQTSDAQIERVIEEANRVRNYRGATLAQQGQAQPIPTGSMETLSHHVKKGDTLYKLSKRYNVEIAAIQAENELSGNGIEIGQSLKIPAESKLVSFKIKTEATGIAQNQIENSGAPVKRVVMPVQAETNTVYAVLPKDTLYSISKRSCVDVTALISTNDISNPNALKPGQKLVMPEGHCLNR